MFQNHSARPTPPLARHTQKLAAAATALPASSPIPALYLAFGICLLAAICALMAVPAKAGPLSGLFNRETMLEIKDESVSLPLAKVTGKASFYKVRVDGTDVIFFTLRDAAGRVRLALDACDSCWQAGKGYKQTNNAMTCQQCGMVFPVERIGLRKGGCNPHPVNFTVSGDEVLIPAAELMDGVRFFRGL